MEDLPARLTRLGRELAEVEDILTAAASNPEKLMVSSKEVCAFKLSLDCTRRFLWLYINVFSGSSKDIALQELSMHQTARMRHSAQDDDDFACQGDPLGFFEEVQNLVTGLFKKHLQATATESAARASTPQ